MMEQAYEAMLKYCVVFLAFLSACSEVFLKDSWYECDPQYVNSCPGGWVCLYNAYYQQHFCYETMSGYCGDGVIDPGEECDGDKFAGQTCESRGHTYGGTLDCDDQCSISLSWCEGYCGDDELQSVYGEECDTTKFGENVCYTGGSLQCSDGCAIDPLSCSVFTRILALYSSTLALTTDGSVYWWGSRFFDENILYEDINQDHPLRMDAPSFTKLAGNHFHACGLTADGLAYCWGRNGDGELGDETTTHRETPVAVNQGELRFKDISISYYTACALTMEGEAYCWGGNTRGELGDGTLISSPTPQKVIGMNTFTSIKSTDYSYCALTPQGRLYCWGSNHAGQLGDGTTTERLEPTPVQEDLTFASFDMGWEHVCGVTPAGELYCWGSNENLQLGVENLPVLPFPIRVHESLLFSQVSCGSGHTCSITQSGDVYCWGSDFAGQLGDGTNTSTASPTPIVQPEDCIFTSLSSMGHTCGLCSSGIPYCWGGNATGQIGDLTFFNRNRPVRVHRWGVPE